MPLPRRWKKTAKRTQKKATDEDFSFADSQTHPLAKLDKRIHLKFKRSENWLNLHHATRDDTMVKTSVTRESDEPFFLSPHVHHSTWHGGKGFFSVFLPSRGFAKLWPFYAQLRAGQLEVQVEFEHQTKVDKFAKKFTTFPSRENSLASLPPNIKRRINENKGILKTENLRRMPDDGSVAHAIYSSQEHSQSFQKTFFSNGNGKNLRKILLAHTSGRNFWLILIMFSLSSSLKKKKSSPEKKESLENLIYPGRRQISLRSGIYYLFGLGVGLTFAKL